ncbi:MAG: biotin--[acetyl-CoA-carboxylase] ligase [Planctomycetes bacterium]|nr:biotin--[acetyl-CoA-carboxylase] ligase [Planctomycetota bacterium]
MNHPKPDEIVERGHRTLGRVVWRFRELASTNNLALELGARLDSQPRWHGLALLADRQTRGRGQHERVWESPPGKGVLMSVLLDLSPSLRRPAILTSFMAVSVASVVERFIGRPAALKWPNDVLVDGRKIAGILVEQARGTVLGVGLNVSQSAEDLVESGLPEATSLACHLLVPPAVGLVAECLLDAMDRSWESIERGEGADVEAAWRDGLNLVGRPVRAVVRGVPTLGFLERLGWDGLAIRLENGQSLPFMPEEVSALAGLDGGEPRR